MKAAGFLPPRRAAVAAFVLIVDATISVGLWYFNQSLLWWHGR